MTGICIVGEGAIARAHLGALERIGGADVISIVGYDPPATRSLAEAHGIPRWTTCLSEELSMHDVDAVILCSPTPVHARQAVETLVAGKHCLIEIPMADSLADSVLVTEAAVRSGRVAMVAHTRRFNAGHDWLHGRLLAGELNLQHLVVETLFLRRTNTNALGGERMWTDDLLWHHACHSVDLFRYQTGAGVDRAFANRGPVHAQLGIATDFSIGLTSPNGALMSLALSFNNEGPFGTTFRYICDGGTFVARYDALTDGSGEAVALPARMTPDGAAIVDGFEAQDREFLSAIAERREPNSSVFHGLESMAVLDRLQSLL